ncbi:hypothetical protein GCM10027590_00100 [Nocardiopsis nanhaiensis]
MEGWQVVRRVAHRPFLRVSGLFQCQFIRDRNEGTVTVVQAVNPLQMVLSDLNRRQLTTADQRRKTVRGKFVNPGHAHRDYPGRATGTRAVGRAFSREVTKR